MCFSSDPEPVAPAPFYPIDIQGTARQARTADQEAYARSDADFASRFPGLVRGESLNLDQTYKNLTGPLDPTIQSSFVDKGVAKSLSAFGGGTPGVGLGDIGSAGRNTTAASFANSVLEKQDYDRGAFNNALASNPQRAIGPSGEDAVSWLIKNTGDQNQINQTNYAGNVQQENAQQAASDANTQGWVSTALTVAGIAALFLSDENAKKNIKTVGKSPMGIPIKTFQYKGDDKKYLGATAQDVEKIVPTAVVKMPKGVSKKAKGLKAVDYSQIDVPMVRIR